MSVLATDAAAAAGDDIAEMTSLAIDDVAAAASMTRLKRWRHAAEIDDDVKPFTD